MSYAEVTSRGVAMKWPRIDNRWTFVLSTRMDIDFAVWALVQDGLRVSPFDSHAEGNGELRTRGLDEIGWVAWVDGLVTSSRWGDCGNPDAAWTGSYAAREQLQHLWPVYRRISRDLSRLEAAISSPPYQNMVSHLWCDLKRYHRGIQPPFVIDFVRYPVTTEFLLPPSTLVLGFPAGLPAPAALRAKILVNAGRLSGR